MARALDAPDDVVVGFIIGREIVFCCITSMCMCNVNFCVFVCVCVCV